MKRELAWLVRAWVIGSIVGSAVSAIVWLLLLAVPAHAESFTRYPNLLTWSDPNPLHLAFTLPGVVARGPGCCVGDSSAHSWMRAEIGLQRRATDWAHPHFNPILVDSTAYYAPGTPIVVDVPHQQPGDVYLVRVRNVAGVSCWTQKPVGAW